MQGLPAQVIVGGVTRYANGKLMTERGSGRFLARKVDPANLPPA